jgi:hypothetical protein
MTTATTTNFQIQFSCEKLGLWDAIAAFNYKDIQCDEGILSWHSKPELFYDDTRRIKLSMSESDTEIVHDAIIEAIYADDDVKERIYDYYGFTSDPTDYRRLAYQHSLC